MNPFNEIINKTREQAEKEAMLKRLLMQAFGFNPVWNKFGYVPSGKPVVIMDDKAYTRENAMDPLAKEMFKSIFGIQGERKTAPPAPGDMGLSNEQTLFGSPQQSQLWRYFGMRNIPWNDADQLLQILLHQR